MAERMMRAALPAHVPVTSAGTRARAGEDIWPEAGAELEGRGISSLGFGSYPLQPALVAGADLVLTATRAHRDEVVAGHPAALRRTFTWRELAWLAAGLTWEDVPGQRAAERVAALAAVVVRRRGALTPPPPQQFDIADPVGRPAGAVGDCAREIEQALQPVIALLA